MTENQQDVPIKKSSNPAIQQRVEDTKTILSNTLAGTGINKQGLNTVARSSVAKDIRLERTVGRAQEAETRAQEAETRATSDPLTGLLNRRGLEMLLEREMARSRRARRDQVGLQQARNKMVILSMDLNDLKEANDTGGHTAGDKLIHDTAESMKAANLRPNDMPARTGGDEFIMVLPETDLPRAITWWNRYDEQLRSRNIHISTGIIELDMDQLDPAKLRFDNKEGYFAQADSAMYVAKAQYKREKRIKGTSDGIENKILSPDEAQHILENDPTILGENKRH